MREISINEIKNIKIGQYEDEKAATGCTVFICEESMPAGVDIRGGGPASRDTDLIGPLASEHPVHAILLSGGSAFGLGAANGVMSYLESKGIGYPVGKIRVPLVVQSDIFDLGVGDMNVRPDYDMGLKATENAVKGYEFKDGNYGVGCGATVGKCRGIDTAMKSGIGSYAVEIDDLQIGAVTVVNAFGDVYDWKTGKKIAGYLTPDKKGFASTEEVFIENYRELQTNISGNTTLSVIITNGAFDQAQLCKIAGMGHDGMARSIRPVHTSLDGDTVYAVSVGDIKTNRDMVGMVAAEVVSKSITRAIYSAESAYGLIAAKDL